MAKLHRIFAPEAVIGCDCKDEFFLEQGRGRDDRADLNETTAAHDAKLFGVKTLGLRPHVSFGPGRFGGVVGQFASLIRDCVAGHPKEWKRLFEKNAVLARSTLGMWPRRLSSRFGAKNCLVSAKLN